MKFKLTTEADKNTKILIKIRDDLESPPAVRIQAIQVMKKMMELSGIEGIRRSRIMNKNIETLQSIRDDTSIESSVRVQAINAIHKILADDAPIKEDYLTEEDVMNKIRGVKK